MRGVGLCGRNGAYRASWIGKSDVELTTAFCDIFGVAEIILALNGSVRRLLGRINGGGRGGRRGKARIQLCHRYPPRLIYN